MKIVTGAIRSEKLGLTLFRVEDILADKNTFYGFGKAMPDEQVQAAAASLQQDLDEGTNGYNAYTDELFAIRQDQIEEAGDYEFLDHLIDVK